MSYKLNDAGTHIVEMPEMKEPLSWDRYLKNSEQRNKDLGLTKFGYYQCRSYESHLANRKKYPLGTVAPPEWKGKELVKDKDFYLQCNGNQQICGCPKGTCVKIIAIPIKDAKMKNILQKIYLQIGDISPDEDFNELRRTGEVTWNDHKINETDIEYILKEDANGRDESQDEAQYKKGYEDGYCKGYSKGVKDAGSPYS